MSIWAESSKLCMNNLTVYINFLTIQVERTFIDTKYVAYVLAQGRKFLYNQTLQFTWPNNSSYTSTCTSAQRKLFYVPFQVCPFLNCRNYLVSTTLVEHTAYSSISWKHIRICADHLRKLILQSSTRMSGNEYWNFRSA